MNIGFYGHSASCWAKFPIYDEVSFIDKIVERYQANLINFGVPQGSEERILFELKKTKQIDLAVIFHSMPKFLFLPGARRDVDITDIGQRKASYLWEEKSTDNESLESFRNDYFSYGGIKENFKEIELFVAAMGLYHEFLYHPDLQMNRFYGALCQIDQYVTNKHIPTVHIYNSKAIPSWFKFSSGVIADDVETACKTYYKIGYPNNVSLEGQSVIADLLSVHIDHVLGRNQTHPLNSSRSIG